MTHTGSHPPASPTRFHLPRRDGRDERVVDFGRLLLGAIVVALGVLFLLDSTGTLDAGAAIDDWWPLAIVAAGVLTLLERPPAVVRGAVLTGGGFVLLLFTTSLLADDAWSYLWPSALIVAGLLIAIRWRGRAIRTAAAGGDVVRATAVFGGPKVASSDQRFRGAWLTAVFGGITLDLRNARPAPDGATINATAAFGGIDILVPKGWEVNVTSMPIFGGVEDKTDRSTPLAADAPTLYIDAVPVFGGVAIKHEK